MNGQRLEIYVHMWKCWIKLFEKFEQILTSMQSFYFTDREIIQSTNCAISRIIILVQFICNLPVIRHIIGPRWMHVGTMNFQSHFSRKQTLAWRKFIIELYFILLEGLLQSHLHHELSFASYNVACNLQ